MTISEQLHQSKTHKAGFDAICPKCQKNLNAIIAELERCAKQNEADAKTSNGLCCYRDSAQAQAVGAEQRRMIRLLKVLMR